MNQNYVTVCFEEKTNLKIPSLNLTFGCIKRKKQAALRLIRLQLDRNIFILVWTFNSQHVPIVGRLILDGNLISNEIINIAKEEFGLFLFKVDFEKENDICAASGI